MPVVSQRLLAYLHVVSNIVTRQAISKQSCFWARFTLKSDSHVVGQV